MVGTLLDAGAGIDAQDGDGQTALHYGAMCAHRAVIAALLARGADPTLSDSDGALPGDVADGDAGKLFA